MVPAVSGPPTRLVPQTEATRSTRLVGQPERSGAQERIGAPVPAAAARAPRGGSAPGVGLRSLAGSGALIAFDGWPILDVGAG